MGELGRERPHGASNLTGESAFLAGVSESAPKDSAPADWGSFAFSSSESRLIVSLLTEAVLMANFGTLLLLESAVSRMVEKLFAVLGVSTCVKEGLISSSLAGTLIVTTGRVVLSISACSCVSVEYSDRDDWEREDGTDGMGESRVRELLVNVSGMPRLMADADAPGFCCRSRLIVPSPRPSPAFCSGRRRDGVDMEKVDREEALERVVRGDEFVEAEDDCVRWKISRLIGYCKIGSSI